MQPVLVALSSTFVGTVVYLHVCQRSVIHNQVYFGILHSIPLFCMLVFYQYTIVLISIIL